MIGLCRRKAKAQHLAPTVEPSPVRWALIETCSEHTHWTRGSSSTGRITSVVRGFGRGAFVLVR
jgi:hypothetical protein